MLTHFKRYIAAAAAALILLQPIYPAVHAAGNTSAPQITVSVQNSGETFESIEKAALYLRSQIRNRAESINITFPVSIYDGDLSNTIKKLFTAALEETGRAAEGDYMRFGIHGMSCSTSTNSRTMTCKLNMIYFTTAEQEDMVNKKIAEIIASLDLDGCSDYEKLCRIYEYVINCAEYEYDQSDNPEIFSAYGALFNGKAVCQGFSQLLYRLSREAGIPCRILAGEDHTWNIARIDGVYYYLDPTWDEFRTTVQQCRYFLKGTKDFDEYSGIIGISDSSHDASGDETALRPGYKSEKFRSMYPISDYAYDPNNSSKSEYMLGDVNGDGIISGSDATITLRAYTLLSSFRDHGLSDAQFRAADADGNNIINGSDATMILNYYTLLSSGYKLSMEEYISTLR